VAVGAVRDAEPRRRRRAGWRFRHHPLRSGLLPYVAGVCALVADADRPDAAPLAQRAEVKLWSRYPKRRLSRSPTSRPARSRVSATSDTVPTASIPARPRSAKADDYLLFLGRFTQGKACCRPSRSGNGWDA
jgi:hypothetical protein